MHTSTYAPQTDVSAVHRMPRYVSDTESQSQKKPYQSGRDGAFKALKHAFAEKSC